MKRMPEFAWFYGLKPWEYPRLTLYEYKDMNDFYERSVKQGQADGTRRT